MRIRKLDMVKLNPARAAGIDIDKGSIAVGKNSDLIILQINDNIPVINQVFCKGNLSYQQLVSHF